MTTDKTGRVALVCHTSSSGVGFTFFDDVTGALEASLQQCGPKCVGEHSIAVRIVGQIRTRSVKQKTTSGNPDDIRAAFAGDRDAARRLRETLGNLEGA